MLHISSFISLATALCLVFCVTILTTQTIVTSGYVYIRNATQKSFGTVVPWPKKLTYSAENAYFSIYKSNFTITCSDEVSKCSIVTRAIARYTKRNYFFDDHNTNERDDRTGDLKQLGNLEALVLREHGHEFTCEQLPNEDMIESYEINISSSERQINLNAKTSWGLIRGLETLSQLIYKVQTTPNKFGILPVQIEDEPRFKFRGYMLDTARHYISLKNIYKSLDAMSFNKLNVFHWHLIDDQSFPYVSNTYPELSKSASFRDSSIYSQENVKSVISYAADRGIRVLPELDSPGHTYSMRTLPNFLTKCYNTTTNKPNGDLGPVNPISLDNYLIMSKLIKEFKQVFPDSYFHAGGDEVDFDCWKSNPEINQYLADKNLTGNYRELQNIYLRKMYNFLTYYKKTMLVWQEVFDSGANLPKNSIVQVWKYRGDRPAYMSEMRSIVNAGYRAILSSCWYLNIIDYGQDWVKFYQCDPTADLFSKRTTTTTSRKQQPSIKQLVLGGEVCMWTEFVDDTNVISRTWPRASAAAERLWSLGSRANVNEFLPRLEQLRCRLLSRGIQAEPVNGPGYC